MILTLLVFLKNKSNIENYLLLLLYYFYFLEYKGIEIYFPIISCKWRTQKDNLRQKNLMDLLSIKAKKIVYQTFMFLGISKNTVKKTFIQVKLSILNDCVFIHYVWAHWKISFRWTWASSTGNTLKENQYDYIWLVFFIMFVMYQFIFVLDKNPKQTTKIK